MKLYKVERETDGAKVTNYCAAKEIKDVVNYYATKFSDSIHVKLVAYEIDMIRDVE